MIAGHRTTPKPVDEVSDRLRAILAGANFTVTASSDEGIEFRRGTYLTQSSPLFPKTGAFRFSPIEGGTRIDYTVALAPFPAVWLTMFGVLFCWLIFPAIIAYRAIRVHPKQMMENILAGV